MRGYEDAFNEKPEYVEPIEFDGIDDVTRVRTVKEAEDGMITAAIETCSMLLDRHYGVRVIDMEKIVESAARAKCYWQMNQALKNSRKKANN